MCVRIHEPDDVVHPARFLAVAGGSTTPNLLLSGGEKYEESLSVTHFCWALRGCFRLVTGKQPGQKR